MTRIKIDLPERHDYATEMRVRVGDANYAGHLANNAVLLLAHEARVRFLNEMGMSEMDAGGAGLIMNDAAVVYEAQAYPGETLRATVTVKDFGPVGCDMFYRFTRTSDGKEIARAKTGVVFFDYDEQKIARVPQAFMDALEKLRG
jgi:4-hydroxybenzoyl-CoA thioesterase